MFFHFPCLWVRKTLQWKYGVGRVKKRKAKVIKGKIIKDPKARGEWVESVFLARAGEEGLTVSKPWGESKRFDFVVGRPPHFVSVQVKCTTVFLHSGYPVAVRHANERYARGSFDFLAGYVVPEDAWYIIPAAKFAGIARLTLCSTSDEARYGEYREAWHLLREAVGVHKKDVHKKDDGQAANETRESGEKPVDRFPSNVFDRMQEVSHFVRKQMQGAGMVPDRDEPERD